MTLLSALLGGGSSSSGGQLQRTLGTTATLGLSFCLLRFLVAKAAAEEDDPSIAKELLTRSEVFYQFVRNVLRRMILEKGRQADEDEDEEDNVPMIHKGSCHCRAVCFEVRNAARGLDDSFQNKKMAHSLVLFFFFS